MQSLFQNKVLWGVVLTFVIGGLGAITGIVSPQTAEWVTLALTFLTGAGHAANLIKGV